MSDVTVVNCPTCGKPVVWGEISPFRPFCSKRCQLIDLGEWAAEEKRIASSGDQSDSDDWSEERNGEGSVETAISPYDKNNQ
ncbi:DNA gyrase inhibitor YacG [Salmonella enterica]|nr:DNA gyrase inhibitor YacG [Salmonella enterica]EEP7551831.1 DNA gyrase inhibitor YacG [Salmonella enterica]